MTSALLRHLHVHDPDLINLRKAGRAVIVVPAVFVLFDQGLGNATAGSFAFFSSFVALVFADFGGPMKARALAYAATILIGDAVIVIASVLADTLVWAALAMFAIMFLVSFAAVYGGYASSFVSPVALAYSFAVFLPLAGADIGDRILGWSAGGLVAMAAALLLWPVDSRAELRQMLAQAAGALAEALAGIRQGDRGAAVAALRRATDRLAEARSRTATPLRPAGLLSRNIGLLHMPEALGHVADLTAEVLAAEPDPDDLPLADEVIEALRQTEAVLAGRKPPELLPEGIDPLDHARRVRRQKVDAAAAAAMAGGGPAAADAVAAMRRSFPLLALSHAVLWVQADAAQAMGAGSRVHPVASAPELSVPGTSPLRMVARARAIAMAELDPDGVIFRNSMRAALAMTLGVILAKLAPVDHRFWITLGVLLVLRSNAAATSANALRAVVGTFAGFLVAAAVLFTLGDRPAALWPLLPLTVFFAAYTPGAISFTVGQVSFTTLVVVLFTLVDPIGMATDVARLETVTLGAITAAAVAMILWPRGARAALAQAIAAVYRATADGLVAALSAPEDERLAAGRRLEAARRRAEFAFGVALGEHGERIDTNAWIALSRAPAITGSLLARLLPRLPASPPGACKDATEALLRRNAATAADIARIADRLDRSATPRPPGPPVEDIEPALRRCLECCAAEGAERVEDALVIIAWNDWLGRLQTALAGAAAALDAVATASAPDAWLHRPRRAAARSMSVEGGERRPG